MPEWDKLKCLIIDDSATMRRIIRASLGRYGITDVSEAADGLSAFEMIKATKFDVILTDWNMPGLDGLELVEKVRQMPENKNTPIIMITTEQGREDVVVAMKSGLNAYIIKPFTPEIIFTKLQAALAAAAQT